MKNLLTYFLFVIIGCYSHAQEYFPINEKVKQTFKNYVAIKNATIYLNATQKLDNATLLFKGDKIVDIGVAINIPNESTIIDATDKYIYPAFIDLYSEFGVNKGDGQAKALGRNRDGEYQYNSQRNGYYWNDHFRVDYETFSNLNYDNKIAKDLRDLGFGTILSHHHDGLIGGTGTLWTLNDNDNNNIRILNSKASQYLSFQRSKLSNQTYPSSLMGSMAAIRQFYHDANWYADGKSKTKDISLEIFNENKNLPQIFNAGDKLNIIRAKKIADEFGYSYIIKGSGNEYERINEIKKSGATIIVPINFPEPYDVSDNYATTQVALGDMRYWNQAPYNLKILAENNVPIIISSTDIKELKNFWTNLRKAVKLGLPKEKALMALTETPAKIIKQFNIGSLKKDNLANFFISSKDVFEDGASIIENWVQGNRFISEKINPTDIRGKYDLTIDNQKYDLSIEGEISKLEGKVSQGELNYGTKLTFNDPWINVVIKSKDSVNAKFTRISGLLKDKKISGKANLENGKETEWMAIKKSDLDAKKEDKKEKPSIEKMFAVTYPNISYGNKEKPKQESILFKNATVWTGEKEGILKETDVLVENGKISKIGKNLSFTGKTIDATGKHLTAGIIDEHSHIAISNGVNEGGQNSSAEVTIEDVVNSEDINIYRNLAGGVTCSQLLHGSANPIGGRSALVKLKWGYSPEEMLVKNNPKYIKFALGENVKQANWGDAARLRFPQSRMGVEQVYEDYFSRALAYEAEWKAYNESKDKNKLKPRVDIELQTISEILNKKRFITCHSYVQSEINMLMKFADRYGFKVKTFTHILEGYKVADKMAKHGVGGSTFSDWWAYKMEVQDAIPHNAALMTKEGVTVSINSDDAEMSRRLNQEAGKTVKYGNISEETAWNFVTINPAKILQVDDRIGSIKVGKDADIVLWTDNPLSIYAKADKTMVEGTIYYDLQKETESQMAIDKERNELINLMLDAKNKGMKTQEVKKKSTGHYHCDTLGERCRDSHSKYN